MRALALVVVLLSPVALAASPAARGVASGREPSAAWVALVKTDEGFPRAWREALQETAEGAVGRDFVPPPAVSIEEAQLALGCTALTDACALQIASMIGAGTVFVVEVDAVGEGGRITTRVIKGGAPAVVRRMDLPDRDAEGLALATLAVRRALAGASELAFLIVDSDAVSAEVLVDGIARGTTPLTLTDLEPGPHRLLVRREGRAPVTREVTLRAGQVVFETVVLGAVALPPLGPSIGLPSAQPATAAFPQPGEEGAAVVGLVTAGVGGALVLGALVPALLYGDYRLALLNPFNYDFGCSGTGGLCLGKSVFTLHGTYAGERRGELRRELENPTNNTIFAVSAAGIGVGALLVATGLSLAAAAQPEDAGDELAPLISRSLEE